MDMYLNMSSDGNDDEEHEHDVYDSAEQDIAELEGSNEVCFMLMIWLAFFLWSHLSYHRTSSREKIGGAMVIGILLPPNMISIESYPLYLSSFYL